MSDAAQPDALPDAENPRETAKPVSLALARIDRIHLDADEGKFAKARPARKRDWRRLAGAASLSVVVAIAAAAAFAGLRATNSHGAETVSLAQRLDTMSSRLEAVEANRTRDEIANLRKVLAEIKANAASTRDMGGAVGQLGARLDKLEKEQSARLDKLAERIDRDAGQRLSELTARLDKLEAKTSAPTVAATPAKPSPELKTAAKAEAGVSNETTGAIAKPPARLRGFYLSEVRDGLALIYGPNGEFAISTGESAPGLGKVLKIERRGREWAVVTTQGQILSEDD